MPSLPTQMRGTVIDSFGGIDKMQVRDIPVPAPDAGELLIKLEYAGIGVWDPIEIQGYFHEKYGVPPKFPIVVGSEGSGTVAAVGDGVSDFKVGDKVYAITLLNPKGGAFAEYVAAKAAMTSRVPKGMSSEGAAAGPIDALTALSGLATTLKIKAGESIAIFGAGGGVGHLAVQLAKRLGAKVLAIASGDDGTAFVKKLGADAVANGRKDDLAAAAKAFAPDGLDAVLLTSGGEVAGKLLSALKPAGRAAHPTGVQNAPTPPNGIKMQVYDGETTPAAIKALNQLIEAGPFTVHVAQTFPLERVLEAEQALSSHYLGKLALKIS